MTLQEAVVVIYAPAGAQDGAMIQKAIDTLNFFRDNILELEDYEVDELYQTLAYLRKNKLEEIT